MTSALELRQVSKVHGSGPTEVHALCEVDLSIERGELVAIMGPSGSGKSTPLTIAGSLEQATSGHVLVDGVDPGLPGPRSAMSTSGVGAGVRFRQDRVPRSARGSSGGSDRGRFGPL